MYGSDIGALGVYIGDLTLNGITSESNLQTLQRIPLSGTDPFCFVFVFCDINFASFVTFICSYYFVSVNS